MFKLKNYANLSESSKCVNISKFVKRDFFLKYLEKKGLLDFNSSKNSAVKKIDSIDIKELLNEKNIKITIFDIFTDYRNFRKEYYTFTNEKVEQDTTKLPFERKDTDIKNIIFYFFFSVIYLHLFNRINFLILEKLFSM
jgi:hypothetical protein